MLHGADREICLTDLLLVKFSSYSEVKGTVAKDMLQGADREICWTGMLLVKGSSYSKKKGTDAKDMLHGADRKICWTDRLLLKGSSYSEMKGTDAKGLFITRSGISRSAPCNISFATVPFIMQNMQKICYTERIGKSVWGDMLLVKGSSYSEMKWTDAKGLFITRSGSGNLFEEIC